MQEPKAKPWPKIEPVEFSVFGLTTKPFSGNKYETRPGCPWMSDKAVQQMTPEGYEMRWNVANYPHSTIHKCIVREPTLHYKSDPGWHFAITTLKKDFSPEQLKTPPSEPRQDVGVIPPEDDRTYAGSSFHEPVSQMRSWRCGKYLIQHGRASDPEAQKVDTPAQHVAFNLDGYRDTTTMFMLAQISALCGTVEIPTAAVTDYPNIGWYAHLHYKSRSPNEYGVPKPPGLPGVHTSTASTSATTANSSRKPRATLKVTTTFVAFITVASCTGAEAGQQNKNDTKSWLVPQSGPVDKLPAIPVALPTETTKSETCPFLPAAVAVKMFTKNHRMDAQVLSDSRNQKIECIAMHPKRGAGLIAKFEFTRSVRPVPVHFRSEPQPIKRPDKTPPEDIVKLTKRYPGVVFTKADRHIWWSCGAVEIKYFKYSDAPKPEDQGQPRSLWHLGVHVVDSAIASLCGTMDKSSKHVTDWPHIVWDRYDAFGGTSPEKYGIPRPTEPANAPYPGP